MKKQSDSDIIVQEVIKLMEKEMIQEAEEDLSKLKNMGLINDEEYEKIYKSFDEKRLKEINEVLTESKNEVSEPAVDTETSSVPSETLPENELQPEIPQDIQDENITAEGKILYKAPEFVDEKEAVIEKKSEDDIPIYDGGTGNYQTTGEDLYRISHLKKAKIVKKDDGYYVMSESKNEEGHHKNLGGPYDSKEKAEKRLRQVEFFKHKGGLKSAGKVYVEKVDITKELEEEIKKTFKCQPTPYAKKVVEFSLSNENCKKLVNFLEDKNIGAHLQYEKESKLFKYKRSSKREDLIERILEHMDYTKSYEDIIADLVDEYMKITGDDIDTTIQHLENSGAF